MIWGCDRNLKVSMRNLVVLCLTALLFGCSSNDIGESNLNTVESSIERTSVKLYTTDYIVGCDVIKMFPMIEVVGSYNDNQTTSEWLDPVRNLGANVLLGVNVKMRQGYPRYFGTPAIVECNDSIQEPDANLY